MKRLVPGLLAACVCAGALANAQARRPISSGRSSVTAGAARPAYAYELRAVKILPPIVYPTMMLNVAVNYTEHDREMAFLLNRAAC